MGERGSREHRNEALKYNGAKERLCIHTHPPCTQRNTTQSNATDNAQRYTFKCTAIAMAIAPALPWPFRALSRDSAAQLLRQRRQVKCIALLYRRHATTTYTYCVFSRSIIAQHLSLSLSLSLFKRASLLGPIIST